MIWLTLVIPLLACLYVFFAKGRFVKWYEIVVPLVVSGIMIGFSEWITEYTQVADVEYWTGYITDAEYYEHWNERVACTHPHYKTVTKTRPKYKTVTKTRGSGKNATTYTETVADGTETYTEQVQDGWQHAYDVDEHAAYWQVTDNNGKTMSINMNEFERIARQFGHRQFVDLHRHYHTINGNKYLAHFNGQDERMEVCTHTHTYENRVQASHSVFKFRKVDEAEKKMYGLFEYPEVDGYRTPMILGYNDYNAEKKLEVLNARFGKKKQIRVWMLVFKNQPLDAAYAQEAYWGGGNKNELVLMLGIDDNQDVQWGHCASWTEREDLKIECRDLLENSTKLNLAKIVQDLQPLVESSWERKHFKDFKDLSIDPPLWAVLTTYLVTLLTNIGIVFGFSRNALVGSRKSTSVSPSPKTPTSDLVAKPRARSGAKTRKYQ